jgi:anti-sigma regulatory factor (Ser/Thr protein kinase)
VTFLHEALIYDGDDEFLTVAVPFLRDGAAAGEAALLGVDERRQRLVLSEVGSLPGLTVLPSGHGHEPLSALRETYVRSAEHIRGGARRVRILGSLSYRGRRWLDCEASINHLFAELPFWGICPYDARETPDEVLMDVEQTHPRLATPGAASRPSSRYGDPAGLLNDRAQAAADLRHDVPPGLQLDNPSPQLAGDAVRSLALATDLDNDSIDALGLSVSHVVRNAISYGRQPVSVRGWGTPGSVAVTISDLGGGPTEPHVGLLPRDPEASLDDANGLHLIHLAITDVSMFTGRDGFTVCLEQREAR